MPTAPEHLRAKWGIDDGPVMHFLIEAGWVMTRDFFWLMPEDRRAPPSAQEMSAIEFLVLEWDFGGIRPRDAFEELLLALEPGEWVDAITLGEWTGLGDDNNEENPPTAYRDEGEVELVPLPKHSRGMPLSLEGARPFLLGWSFFGDLGCSEVRPVRIWTNRRIGVVRRYDGATSLEWIPRNPKFEVPETIGGE